MKRHKSLVNMAQYDDYNKKCINDVCAVMGEDRSVR